MVERVLYLGVRLYIIRVMVRVSVRVRVRVKVRGTLWVRGTHQAWAQPGAIYS